MPSPHSSALPKLVGHRATLVMRRDVFGPSRCLSQFASQNILPKRFLCETTPDGHIMVHFEFEEDEDEVRVNRTLAKLAQLPVMLNNPLTSY